MTSTYLLDTNTFSYIVSGRSVAARREFERLSKDRDALLSISAVTEGEVRYGMAKRGLSVSRRAAIEGLFANLQILPWGSEEATVFGETKAKLEARGISVDGMDLLIAAQAIAARATFVTHDKVFALVDDLTATVDWAKDVIN